MMRLIIVISICYVSADLRTDLNCVLKNPLVLDAGLDLFVHQVWDTNGAAKYIPETLRLITSRFKGVHKYGVISAETLRHVGPSFYAKKSSKSHPLYLTMKLTSTTDDLTERVSLLKQATEAVIQVNSALTNPVIFGLYLHLFTGSFEMQLEAVEKVFGKNGSSNLQLGHFSPKCGEDFEDPGVMKYYMRMDFITCEVLPSKNVSPNASADHVIQSCNEIRDAASDKKLTAKILCRTEYYTHGTAESGIAGSLDHFRQYWCRIVEELKRNRNHTRIIMWAAFDQTSLNVFIDDATDTWRDQNKAEYHTGWWRRTNSANFGQFVEKIEALPNCKRACAVCNSSGDCCNGMLCAASSVSNPKICLSEGSSCPAVPSSSIESEKSLFDDLTIAIFTAIVLSVIFVSCLVGFLIYRKQAKIRVLSPEDVRGFFEGSSNPQTGGELQAHELAEDLPYDTSLEVCQSKFEIYEDQILGLGSFGVVVKGRMENDEVAVKTTLPGVSKIYLKALMTEMKVLMYLGKHENIVNLRGSSTTQLYSGKLYLFLELCSLGNLLGFLRSHRDHFSNGKLSEELPEETGKSRLSCKDLLRWSLQIANALKYLAEKQVIHGDIAARNILVFSTEQVKLTDFGLSRRLYEYSNYVKNNQEPLPWRHMSLEALRDLSFSLQSDVWAFGVTLWETFSLGEVPFPSHTWSENYIQLLQDGLRPPQTQYAHALIYELMKLCWTADVKSRPSIILVHTKLISTLDELYCNAEYLRAHNVD